MLSVGTISAGSGYKYLTEEVATGAEDYYVRGVEEIGERPGRWIGSGSRLLDLEGVVRPEQMALMYGQGLHPEASLENPLALGPPFPRYKSVPERLAEARAANPGADAEEWERIEQKIRKAGERSSVAGFDLTFSPPKSWSVLWAAAPNEEAREVVWAAHHEGVDAALAYLEREACFSRTGHGGVRQVDADGFVAAAFDHRQSRNGDPQMHTHVAVLNRVRCTKDGVWRTLDSREVFAAAAAAGGMYDLARETALERSLGVVHEFRRPGDEVREIEGISDDVISKFSTRRQDVEDRLDPMLAEYEAKHGRAPSEAMRAQMSEWATLGTRPAKGHGETVGDALARWEAHAHRFGSAGLAQEWEAALDQRYNIGARRLSLSDIVLAADQQLEPAVGGRIERLGRVSDDVVRTLADAGIDRGKAARLATCAVMRAAADGTLAVSRPEDLASTAVSRVAAKKATWTRNDLARQVERLTRRDPDLPPEGLQERVDRLVELALRPGGGVVALTAPPLVEAPDELRRRSDGRSEHGRHTAVRYAAGSGLLAEGRLVATARKGGAPVVAAEAVAATVGRSGLGADQEAAARAVLGSGRRVDAIVGPAGTGKTHTTAAITAAWNAEGRPVLGLALSQHAARVLAEASDARAENIAKWLFENGAGRPGWQVEPGLLVVVDEAAMVPTAQLDQVVGRVVAGGGKVVLVGDPEQLAAPGAGGAMGLVVAEVGAAYLEEVRRFASSWEAEASLRLRAGDPDSLVEYDRRARISGGTPEEVQEAAYTAWLADSLSGRTSLLLADTNDQAAELAGRARADLARAGRVDQDGVVLGDGNRAGAGDRVVTRRNDRQLGGPDRMVANRDEWTVAAVGADGSLQVRRHGDPRSGVQTLPAGYVADHVQLAYASTVHAAQARTVDTSHAVVGERTGRDGLYVAMTRGREGNWAYVACDTRPAQDEAGQVRDPVVTLAGVLTTSEPAVAATQILRDDHDRAESLHTLYPQWKDALDEHNDTRWAVIAAQATNAELAAQLRDGPGWPTLVARLQALKTAGVDGTAALTDAVAGRELSDAVDAAAVVDWRLRRHHLAGNAGDDQTVPGGPAPQATFLEATPDHAGPPEAEPLLAYARQLAARMDERVEVLEGRVVDDPPRWADPLGPVPEDPAGRLEWAERAGAVAGYQEIVGGDADNPLGARPGPGQPDIRARWDSAADALYGPPVAAEIISDEDLRAIIDRADELAAKAPDIVVDRLRDAAHFARVADTRAGLLELDGAQRAGVEDGAMPAGEVAAAARADLHRLEEQHELRLDWLAEHGPEVAAGPGAAAELAHREEERAARPFLDLDDAQLHAAAVDARGEVASLDQQRAGFVGVVDSYRAEAAELDQQATTTEWERPTWTAVNQERHAETAAVRRLAEIEDRLDRSVLRGGPRGHERAELHVEADGLRASYTAATVSDDLSPVWEGRAETAWAQDTASVEQLRANAVTLRDKADQLEATTLPRLTDQRDHALNRVGQLVDEQQQRQGEPPRARQTQALHPNPFGPWASLSSEPDSLSRSRLGLDEPTPNLNPHPGHGPQL